MKIQCPNCPQRYEVTSEHFGKTVVCQTCEKPFVVVSSNADKMLKAKMRFTPQFGEECAADVQYECEQKQKLNSEESTRERKMRLKQFWEEYVAAVNTRQKQNEREQKQKLNSADNSRKREHIPKEVQREVWRRDEGKCVDCGSKEKLEYDHIIPVSEGGANTVRNLQILCEKCNRKKYNKI